MLLQDSETVFSLICGAVELALVALIPEARVLDRKRRIQVEQMDSSRCALECSQVELRHEMVFTLSHSRSIEFAPNATHHRQAIAERGTSGAFDWLRTCDR